MYLNVRELAKCCVFPMICVSGESKSRLVKAAGVESSGQRRNQKIARGCGEKRIFKWKCTNHASFEALFEVPMSKNCTPLWREARFEVKMPKSWGSQSIFWSGEKRIFKCKTRQVRSAFRSSDVEKLAAVARSAFSSENVQNTSGSDHFLKFRCPKISQLACLSVNQSVKLGGQLVN